MSEVRDIQEPLCAYLRKQGIPFIRSRPDRESTIEVGWPDVTILFKPPIPVLLIETKDKDTRTTAAQLACHERLRASGHTVVIARSLAIAVEAIQTWQSTGIVRHAALGSVAGQEWAIAQDGTNGDFVWHRGTGEGKWLRKRRPTMEDLASLPRIHIRRCPV